ncbi:MAG: hypothetical protein EOP48_02385 [Sphingobacteriales bacterium]|nr:MAG: hypothetical protein EOP48_02385 [Sphingobacteriales bacterium]
MVREPYNYTLRLTKEDIDKLPDDLLKCSLPPSISVLFRVTNGAIFIEGAGGATATSLLGRFTLFNDQIAELARELAKAEQAANPSILFAEIVHVCDTHTANIDRREVIRPYEIPVLSSSGVELEYQIHLDDLYLKHLDNKLILFSKKHNKRVIPRLSSAYNHHLSQLSIFRFLCDLQSMGLKTGFGFHMKHLIPGLDFYPRLEYGSVIVQLATWIIKKELIDDILSAPNSNDRINRLADLSLKLCWPRFIAIEENDNQLIFDTTQQWDVEFLSKILKKGKSLEVTEFPFVGENEPLVKDTEGNPYLGQFVTSLYQKKNIYRSLTAERLEIPPAKKVARHFLPGSEWLYLKIYCHPVRSNLILVKELLPFIVQQKDISQWFFVRYDDPEHHLRVRINLAFEDFANITTSLEKCFSKLISIGLIRDYQFATYERELERYGSNLIMEIEAAFCASSELVLQHFSASLLRDGEFNFDECCLSDVHCLLDIFKIPLLKRIELFKQLYTELLGEVIVDGHLYRQLNLKYREVFHSFDSPYFIRLSVDSEYRKAFVKFYNIYSIIAKKAKYFKAIELLTDLIHMHLNRCHDHYSRRQEAVVYYCLWKYYIKNNSLNNLN